MESLGAVQFLDSFWSVRSRPASMLDVGKEHHTSLFVCMGALCRCTCEHMCVDARDLPCVPFLRDHPPWFCLFVLGKASLPGSWLSLL